MIFDIAQLIVFLATVAAYGYYLYLIGKVKGLLQAVNVVLLQRKEENENDACTESVLRMRKIRGVRQGNHSENPATRHS